MHPALERLARDVKTWKESKDLTEAETAKWALIRAAPALIAALVEIEERARVSDDNSVFDVEILQIIHKHFEPLKPASTV